ncbi:MAG: DUF3047 domain-containing protein [Gammaproteobacteria bacterium]|nr:DUF3047 domain-containing protein [Gammaproteobacteria bacterium]
MPAIFLLTPLLLLLSTANAGQRIDVGKFSQGDVSGWEQESFVGETRYELTELEGNTSLQATSDSSASAYYYRIKIDLTETPILNWSWQKLQTLDPGDEKAKSGDDFVARVYVIKDGGLLFWNTRAINYVWSHQHARDEVWDNPFAGANAKMLAQRDRNDAEQTWYRERRNVVEDFAQLHGKDIDHIDGIAIMTDSDNSGLDAGALYGDIYFTAD